jgi:hypothetical protein
MKTGNGQNPNPRKVWGGTFKEENSNMVKSTSGSTFSAKRDVMGKKQGPMKRGKK